MSNARVSQPEYNYILHGQIHTSKYQPFVQRNVKVDEPLAKALAKNPTFALTTCWKHTAGRSGLSPFVLHYLLKEERTIEEYIAFIKGYHQKIWNYSYCGTTFLPVVSSYASIDWSALQSFKLMKYGRLRIRDPWEINYINRQLLQRDEAAEDGKVLYAAARRAADVDEAMRNFKGSTIGKPEWLHLKGVAGIYA